LSHLRRIAGRPELVFTFLMIFLTDVSIGIYRTTFSLFADSLGASLALIGVLGGVEGLVRILVSMPIGALSDRIDRRKVVAGGLLTFALCYGLTALVRNPLLLYPIRCLTGIAVASTFYVGVAFISDIADERDQGLSIGIYTTCMGLGFAVGSGLGGRLAADVGFGAGFFTAAGVVLLSFSLLTWGPGRQSAQPRPAGRGSRGVPLGAQLGSLLKNPVILAACLGHLSISMSNEGAVFSFFPLYAASLGIGKATIGGMFSVRMVASAATRLPTGAFSRGGLSRKLMLLALLIGTTSELGLALSSSPLPLTVLLAGEGIAFGMYFASGSAAIAQNTREANRGAATGLFTTMGSLGSTLGPVGLGQAADHLGLSSVFLITSAALFLGLAVSLILGAQAQRNSRAIEE